jgi:ABC-2 type transport system permease protein
MLNVAGRILLELGSTRRSLLFWVLFPALMLLLFGLIYAEGGSTGHSFDRTAPGILIGAALFFSCLGGPITVLVGERERHTLKRVLLSPLPPTRYFLGVFLAFCVVAAVQTVVVYGIAFAFGAAFHGSLPLGVAIVGLSVLAYVTLGFHFGARFARTTEEVNGPLAALGVPLLVLGGTFFDPSILPPYLMAAAQLDPIFHMNEALKAVSAEGAGWRAVADHMLVLGGFALFAALIGLRAYGRLLREEGGS